MKLLWRTYPYHNAPLSPECLCGDNVLRVGAPNLRCVHRTAQTNQHLCYVVSPVVSMGSAGANFVHECMAWPARRA